MSAPDAELADRQRWNERYRATAPSFAPHPLVAAAVAAGLPDGPVLELACGRSGSALALARAGRTVTAVDVSDVALDQLAAEATRRGLGERVRCVRADVATYTPEPGAYALVIATLFWDADVFARAGAAVAPGGLLVWEALAAGPAEAPPGPFRVRHGDLAAALAQCFAVLTEERHDAGRHASTRLLARRQE